MLIKIQIIFFELIFILMFSVRGLYAMNLFTDDFNYRDNLKWNYSENGGNIDYKNGILSLSSESINFPYILNSAGSLLTNIDGVFEFKFNYIGVDYMGNGLSIGFTSEDGNPNYQFSIWNDLFAGPMFQYQNFNMFSNGTCDTTSNILGLQKISLRNIFDNNIWHILKVIKNGNRYQVLLDSINIYETSTDQCLPTNIFIGNPFSGGRTWWSKLSIDYIRLYSGVYNKNKIIIFPGLGASWNAEAILLGTTVPNNQWSMTPFVKNYDLLINALESNNLVRNQDFYVWNYDWRKPLEQIVSDFNNYVNSLNLEAGQKVDLLGHSLGGLVARLWTQEHSDLVDKTITLGSPHFGALKAYEAWNGAKISDNLDVASIALNILLQLQKKNNDTAVQTLRTYAPIVFDLSPTFSFLKRNGSAVTEKFSQYLALKNNVVSTINDKLSTVDGNAVLTKEWITLGDRSLFDKVLGIWEDGRPLSYLNGVGDGTVLKKSALISGSENIDFNSNHGELVDKSTNWILQKLDLGVTTNITSNYPIKQAVFYLGSPATMTVNCGGTQRSEVNGFVVVENQESKNCTVNLVGVDGGGTYHLVAGGGSNDWQYFEGEIANNQFINIVMNSVDAYWQMLRRDLTNLGAVTAVAAVDQRNIVATIDEYFKFRMQNKNYKYSEEILENMKYILNTKSVMSAEINSIYLKALTSKSLVETNLRLMARNGVTPQYSAAINYEQGNNMMILGKNYSANYLANKLFGIVWK